MHLAVQVAVHRIDVRVGGLDVMKVAPCERGRAAGTAYWHVYEHVLEHDSAIRHELLDLWQRRRPTRRRGREGSTQHLVLVIGDEVHDIRRPRRPRQGLGRKHEAGWLLALSGLKDVALGN